MDNPIEEYLQILGARAGWASDKEDDETSMPVPVEGEESDEEYTLLTELSEDRTHGYLRVALPPQVGKDDVEVTVQGEVIRVKVTNQRVFLPDEKVIKTEIAYGTSDAELHIPQSLFDLSTISAQIQGGLVIVKFAKRPEKIIPAPRRIPLESSTLPAV